MKTPEEIKKAFECCMQMVGCANCPYRGEKCALQVSADTLAYIAQLEANQIKWNSTKDKLPDMPMFYAITKYNADPKIYRKNLVDPDYTSEWLNIRNEILWWIPIPDVPKGD